MTKQRTPADCIVLAEDQLHEANVTPEIGEIERCTQRAIALALLAIAKELLEIEEHLRVRL